ncbi:MAG: PTS sugar transporter subunit IIA [Phycisphaerales bacterium]|nr:MAG: PTS sugar transporter subunit IIA [Phycisphaerales bacterium]
MKLADIIHPEAVIPELKGTTRNDVIRELVQALADAGAIDADAAEAAAKAVILRERQGTTGFGYGVAVPHQKVKCVKKVVAAIGRSSRGVDFASLDRAPVYSIVLLLSPDGADEAHLAAMEKIFRRLQQENFRRFLRRADTREAITDLIKEADELQEE